MSSDKNTMSRDKLLQKYLELLPRLITTQQKIQMRDKRLEGKEPTDDKTKQQCMNADSPRLLSRSTFYDGDTSWTSTISSQG